MRNLLIIFFVLLSFIGFGQNNRFPNKPTQSNIQTSNQVVGQWSGNAGISGVIAADTNALNALPYVKSKSFNIGHTYTDKNTWYRSPDTLSWVLLATTSSNCGGTRLIDGSITWSGTAYNFNATVLHYGIICRLFTSDTATLTVAPADPTYPRIDVFYADTSGQVGIIQGTPSATPIKPSVNQISQIEISFVYVPAGSVTPDQRAIIVYNENIEWASASNIPSINFNYATNPYTGSKSTLIPNAPNGSFVSWQNGSLITIDSVQYLKGWIRLNGSEASPLPLLTISLYSGATQVTNTVTITNGAYGFNATVLNAWQLFVIPTSAFTPISSSTTFDKANFVVTNAPTSFQLDYIYFLSGASVPPVIGNFWGVNGNTGTNPNLNYAGTQDSVRYNLGTNGKVRMSILGNGINETADTTMKILVIDLNDPQRATHWISQPSIFALGCLKIYDSTSAGVTRKYIRDTCSSGGGGGSSFKFVISQTEPSDTSVGWINTSINIHECNPVQYHVNGQWNAVDTIAGQFYDNVGKVFTVGYPYTIFVTGQSNVAGPYIAGWSPNPGAPPYNGYYGDTIPTPSVAAWDYGTNSWKEAQLGTIPFASASGANFVMLTAKKIAKEQGKSVRIVMTYKGGTPLQCWSGAAVGGIPDTAECYIAFTNAIAASGVKHPNLFIWGQSEAGITGSGVTATTFYTKWRQMVDSLRSQGYIDTTTAILFCGSGDPAYGDNPSISIGATGDGAGRAIGIDADRYTDYVDVLEVQTDGIHFTPLGHEEIARRMFQRLADIPIDLQKKPLGYGDTSAYRLLSDSQKVIVQGLWQVSPTGHPFTKFENGAVQYTDAYNSSLGYPTGLLFSRSVGSGQMELYDYGGYGFTLLSDGNIKAKADLFYTIGTIRSQTGANPQYQLYDVSTGKIGRLILEHQSNYFSYSYDNNRKLSIAPVNGNTVIGSSNPDLHSTAKLNVESTSQGMLAPRITAAARLAARGVQSITVSAGGTGYVDGSMVSITGGSGSGALARVVAPSGVITSITIVSTGTGYTGTPTATAPTGSGAVLVPVVAPATGLLVFDTDSSSYFQWTGSAWQNLYNSGSGGAGLTSLNGLTGATQTFATGTTGTDFGIVSTGTSHTFNLPTASASNRGLLSSTDWSTFNGKQSAITFGTGVQTALGVNVGSAGAPVLFNGALGTPSSGAVAASLVTAGTFGTGAYTMGTSLNTPTVYGGTGTTSRLALIATTGVGTTGSGIDFKGGNNGATTFATVSNAGAWDFQSGTITTLGNISGNSILAAGQVRAAASSPLSFNGRASIYSSADAVIDFRNNANNAYASTQSLYDRWGSGSPEGVVTAPVGATYHRTDGGANTSFYVKESGSGNTGWVAK